MKKTRWREFCSMHEPGRIDELAMFIIDGWDQETLWSFVYGQIYEDLEDNEDAYLGAAREYWDAYMEAGDNWEELP